METPIFHLDKVVHGRAAEIQDFDGPLDLILHLLSKNKMEIREIRISEILDQYLEWMHAREELDLEVASEFILMAAHLVYIKTRMLLALDDEEGDTEMDDLIASLEARQRNESYLKIKAVAPQFADRYQVNKDLITKAPEVLPEEMTRFEPYSREDLTGAMVSMLARAEHKLPPPITAFQGVVGREPYPVASKAEEIVRRLIKNGMTRFRALFRGNRSRSEVVATFLAVLELCKAHCLRLSGTEEDCTVIYTPAEGAEAAFSSEEL